MPSVQQDSLGGWLGGLTDSADIFAARVAPSTIGRARLFVANRGALKGVSPAYEGLALTQDVFDAYDAASAKLVAAAQAKKACTFTADEWRALIAVLALGHATLAHSGALPFVPNSLAELKAERAKAEASASTPEERAAAGSSIGSAAHGLIVADVRGTAHKDPTVNQGLAYSRGAIALLKKASKVETASAGAIDRVSFSTDSQGARVVRVLDSAAQEIATLPLGSSPTIERTIAPAIAAAIPWIIGGAVVLGLGGYGVWSWRDTTKYEIDQKNAGTIAAASGMVQALLLDMQDAAKTGRPVNPAILGAVSKVATQTTDSTDWTAPLVTFGIGGVFALGAGWLVRRFLRGRR